MRQHRPVRLIFEGTGSRGDVAPLLALAATLARRGYACQVLSNSGYEAEAKQAGIEFHAIADRNVAFSRGERVPLGEYLFAGLPAVARWMTAANARDYAVINLTRLSASNLFCERRGIATVRLSLSPFAFRSLTSPPWPYREKTEGPMGELYRRNVLPRLYEAFDTNPRVLRFVNQRRLAFGLEQVGTVAYPERHVVRHVAAFPTWFCGPAMDWPRGTETTGFPLPAPSEALPQPVLNFLARHGPPILFTRGTFVDPTDAFVALARGCCERLGVPGIFLSKLRPSAIYHSRNAFLEFPFAELALLLPRCSAIVHHGGIGTTARALEAAVPQIFCPIGFDQFDNAHRVRLLEAGAVVNTAALTAASLGDGLVRLLQQPGLHERLRALATRVSDGLALAADRVETAIRAHAPRDIASSGKEQPPSLGIGRAHAGESA